MTIPKSLLNIIKIILSNFLYIMFPQVNSRQSFSATQKSDEWNEEKKFLHSEEIGERYIKMGMNIGNEQNGKWELRRPVLVIRRIGNIFFALPLTTQWKENNRFYLALNTSFEDKKSWIIVSQWKTFDKKRFLELVGTIPAEEFYSIKKSLKNIYFWET